ncbi:MAG: nodulation protein NfeD [Candidatus Thermoplasmatota archaeon]|nr:nodulation protein NfeD [Candidatus Thermoplasmatota archaeon]
MKKLLFVPVLFLAFILTFSFIKAESNRILVTEIDGPISSATVSKIEGAIELCEREGIDTLIIEIDTDGGLVSSLFSIIEAIENTDVIVVGYVTNRAFSAGALLLQGCDVAAMKPYTVLGSAHPVTIGATGTAPIEDNKTVNAIAEYAEAKALAHNRNGEVAKRFVTENLNLRAEEALSLGSIEFVGEDIQSLLLQINGFTTSKGSIDVTGKAIQRYNTPLGVSILETLGDPTIASILMLVGIYALIFGLVSPGFGAEIAGVVLILLGLIGSGFNISYIALAFIILGAILLIFELVTPEFGILGVSGIILMALGGIFIIPLNTEWYVGEETVNSMYVTIIGLSVFLAAFIGFAIYKVLQARKKKPEFSIEGKRAKAIEDLNPEGFVIFNGEYWRAKSISGRIEKGTEVTVTGKDGSALIVKASETRENH